MMRKIKFAFYVWAAMVSLPFVLLAAWIYRKTRKNHLVRKAVRTTREGLQTATLTFEKPDQNQVVKLYGMIHVGQLGYYEEIDHALVADMQDGHTILYEKVTPPTDEELKKFTKEERQLHEAMKGLGAHQTEMAKTLGLVHQMDAIELREEWVHSDLTQIEFIRLLIAAKLTRFVLRMFGMANRAGRRFDIIGRLFEWALQSHVAVALVAMLLMLPKYRKFKSIILDKRNEVAHEGIMKALQTSNRASATWGAAHLPGMSDMLADQGFALTDTEWRTAFTFEKQSFIDTAKAIGKIIWEGIKDWLEVGDDDQDPGKSDQMKIQI